VQLAQVASVALEKAVDFQREHEVAVALQRSMLPQHLAEVAGLATHVAYLPGRGESDLSVGGDFYDAFTLDDDHVALALGDVVGHGLLSASLHGTDPVGAAGPRTAPARPGHRRHRSGPAGRDPGRGGDGHAGYGVLHVPSGRLRLVLAGHPPPLLRTAGEDGWEVAR
jgi:serine phosphatase RsbU (regulator of sigma subunit)